MITNGKEPARRVRKEASEMSNVLTLTLNLHEVGYSSWLARAHNTSVVLALRAHRIQGALREIKVGYYVYKSCVTCDMYVVADSSVSLLSAVVYTVKSIWVTPTEVLSTERPDNGDTRLMSARIDREQLGGNPA
eukprot:COSAG02_NODE_3183_length_7215_cov_13.727234_5_plen_134_part_00